jgi:hypothetical protein
MDIEEGFPMSDSSWRETANVTAKYVELSLKNMQSGLAWWCGCIEGMRPEHGNTHRGNTSCDVDEDNSQCMFACVRV